MRIVAGVARGRRLVTPPGLEVRPTTDRVREALFNSLGSLDALRDARVLDLFAGSGALGIEALSRGAESAVFVDVDGAALAAVRANLGACELEDRATVLRDSAESALGRVWNEPFDLVLADPPYARDDWPELFGLMQRPGLLAPGSLVVAESNRRLVLPDGWTTVRERSYGRIMVVIARPGSLTGGSTGDVSD